MRKPIVGAGKVFPPYGRYHHGISVEAGSRLVFLSGQLGIAADGAIPNDLRIQTELVFANIDALLEEAALERRHVVRLSTFLLDPADRADFMAVRDAWVADPAPASTLVFIRALARPEFLVEVEAIAVG